VKNRTETAIVLEMPIKESYVHALTVMISRLLASHVGLSQQDGVEACLHMAVLGHLNIILDVQQHVGDLHPDVDILVEKTVIASIDHRMREIIKEHLPGLRACKQATEKKDG
jgi:hypothetical protein